MLLQLLYIMGGSTIFIWLGKLIISKSFDAGIERYKHELNKQIEEHKAEIAKLSHEHHIRFERLHEERANKMQSIFALVVEVEQALIHSTTFAQGPGYGNDDQREQSAIEKLRQLISTFDRERIFFSNATAEKVENIIKEAWDIIFTMNKVRRYAFAYDTYVTAGKRVPEYILSETDLWSEAEKKTQTVFKHVKDDLANEFRMLLGI